MQIFSSGWDGTEGHYKAAQILNASQTFSVCLYWYGSLYINQLTTMDLIRLIKTPFKKPGTYLNLTSSTRSKIGTLLGFLVVVLSSSTITYF